MPTSSSNNRLDRLVNPIVGCLNLESAKRLVALRADPVAQDRIEQLAEASTEGGLSPEDRAEYEAYVAVSSFIVILQSKAKAMLTNQGGL